MAWVYKYKLNYYYRKKEATKLDVEKLNKLFEEWKTIKDLDDEEKQQKLLKLNEKVSKFVENIKLEEDYKKKQPSNSRPKFS